MSGITVHALDTARGVPAAGLPLTLSRLSPVVERLATVSTNSDGRVDGKLLEGASVVPGLYEVVFDVGAWRAAMGEPGAGFYDTVPIRFRIDDATAHYHIPLLISPYGYSTYRGS